MAVKKTHVKSAKRQAKDREKAALDASRQRRAARKPILGRREKTVVQTGFKFKSQSERYKDISVDLKSLLEDAVERYGKYDVDEAAAAARANVNIAMDVEDEVGLTVQDDGDDDMDDDDMMSTPLSAALAELALLNTTLPFQALHRALYTHTRSLPLIIHHRHKIARTIIATLNSSNRVDVALCAAHTVDIIPPFIQSLSPDPDFQLLDFESILTPMIRTLVATAVDPPSTSSTSSTGDRGNDLSAPTEISKRCFQVIAWIFRQIGGDLVNRGNVDQRVEAVWQWVREGLEGEKPNVELPEPEQRDVKEESVDDNDNEPFEAGDTIQGPFEEPQDPVDLGEKETKEQDEGDATPSEEEDVQDDDAQIQAITQRSRRGRRPMSATKPHLRRLLATSFAFLVRKAKTGGPLEAVIQTMLQAVTTTSSLKLSESVAWIVVESIKSVETHIHSRGPAIFKTFVRLSEGHGEKAASILCASLTALTHHSTVEHFGAMVELILTNLKTALANNAPSTSTGLALAMRLADAIFGTRKGSRLTEKAIVEMFSICDALSGQVLVDATDEGIRSICVELLVKVLLVAPNLEVMLSRGRKVLERVWQSPKSGTLAASALATLSAQKWAFFDDFAAPLLTSRQSSTVANPTGIALLARVAENGHLKQSAGLTQPLADTLTVLADAWLKGWKNGKLTDRQTMELIDCLNLCSHATMDDKASQACLKLIAEIVRGTEEAKTAQLQYQETPLNPAYVLSCALQASNSVATSSPITAHLVQDIVEKYTWHRNVLENLLNVPTLESIVPPLNALAGYLRCNITSGDSDLRRSSLRLLLAASPDSEVIKRALEVEMTPLTIQDAREKNQHIRRLGVLLKTADPDCSDFLIGVRYTIAMLKVNFKPLWQEAIASLTEVVKHVKNDSADQIWQILREELEQAANSDSHLYVVPKPGWANASSSEDDAEVADPLRAGEFRCTSNARISRCFGSALEAFDEKSNVVHDCARVSSPQITLDRLVVMNYEAQLLLMAASMSILTEKHSRDFVAIFFSHFGSGRGGQEDSSSDEETSDASGGRAGRQRLASWLGVFSKFKNPKALYRSEDYHEYVLATLSHGDANLQKLALDCLLTWKSPNLLPHETNLRNLLDDVKFRDELLQFSIAENSDAILPSRRPEVVPVMIRILYGLMSSRQGRASAMHVQAGRKAAVLAALRACSSEELNVLADLMVAPFDDQLEGRADHSSILSSQPPQASTSRQIGFLSLLADVIKSLGSKLVHRWDDLVTVTLNLAHHSQPTSGLQESPLDITQATPKRRVRQLAVRRLADFFSYDDSFASLQPFLPAIFHSLISPRLASFPAENAQAPSALLELVSCWANKQESVFVLVEYDSALLPALYDCLSVNNVKDAVVKKVLDVVQSLLSFASEPQDDGVERVISNIIKPHLGRLLDNLAILLRRNSSTINARDDLGVRQISILSALSPFIVDSTSAEAFVPILLPLLRKPNVIIPEKVKLELLRILIQILPLTLREAHSEHYINAYDTISSLFATLRSAQARFQLVATFSQFIKVDPGLEVLSKLLGDLNAFSPKRIEVPDFDRRLAAFARLNDGDAPIPARHWVPIVHTMFFFIQDPEELSIRSNANRSLQKFVTFAGPSLDADVRTVFHKIFLPGLRSGLKSKVEMVRIEIVSILSETVKCSTGIAELEEMKCLLAGGDAEANFFNNIYHVQIHRRTRAMRRLADEAGEGHLSSKTIADIFLPLLQHNLVGISENKNAELINETVSAVGRLSKSLAWSAYLRVLQQYLKLAKDSREGQKVFVRTTVAILRAFHFDLNPMVGEDHSKVQSRLLPVVLDRLLPQLMQFLEKRDEAEEAIRIPVAEGIAVIIQHLPEDEKAADVTSLVTALAQILRSKTQDTRDLTRSTLVNIASLFGPAHFAVVVKELRAALARGPQLHVLAYTLHALLVRMVAGGARMTLDGCLDDAVPIVFDDIFGQPAKDRESQEFRSKTKIKEVRQSKSLDSIEILAKSINASQISKLLGPVRNVLSDTESLKTMRDVDDVLRHIVIGVQANPTFDNKTLLTLCQALISQNSDFLKPRKRLKKGNPGNKHAAAADYHVQTKRPTVQQQSGDRFVQNAHRFVSFGLDLLNGAFRKNKFDLSDADIVSRLDPLISQVGNCLYAEEAHILDRAMRAISSLIRCPLRSIEKAAPLLVKQMMSILEHTGGTSSELSQTCIRTLATIIRDRKSVVLGDEQLQILIATISPDLEETEQQPALFALLRAIISRSFVVPEVYDLMDRVAEILITNQSSSTREICRSIYLQFLLDYPQGKKRLSTSMEFLAKNVGGYLHESGRTSALELVNAILTKFSIDLVDQYASLFFVALTMDIANDQSSRCREMAAENIKVLVRRTSKSTKDDLLKMLFVWTKAKDQSALLRTSAQVLGITLEALSAKSEVEELAKAALPVLSEIVQDAAETLQEDGDEEDDIESDWQVPYQAIQSLSRLFKVSPTALSDSTAIFWESVRTLLLFPHVWVRNAAARLLGVLFAGNPEAPTLQELIDAAAKSTVQLRSKLLDDTLSLQIVKNLFFIGKRFARVKVSVAVPDEDDGDEEPSNKDPTTDPLHWLFVKLSHRARVAHQTRPSKYALESRESKWSLEPSSILRFFGAIVSEASVTVDQLERQKLQILIPIVRITDDPNGAKDPQLDELQVLAREVQELLSQKVGVTGVAETYSEIRQKIAVRREERKRGMALSAINDPEVDARRRAKRNESKAKSRKRKNEAYAQTKMRYGQKGGAKRSRAE